MKKIILSFFALSLIHSVSAQHSERCANGLMHQEYLNNTPSAKTTFQKVENQLQKIIQKNYTKKNVGEVYQVPVVIHVMHIGEAEGVGNNISDSQIMSGLKQLNDAFRNTGGQSLDTKIEFVLAKQDPNCAATTGIIRYDASGITDYATAGVSIGGVGADEVTLKAASKWPNTDYYNIWIVNEIGDNDGGFGTQGYAYFPGTSSARDGTIILNTAWGNEGTANSWNNQGKTGIHELGHGLNLYHTFNTISAGDTTANGCPSNTSCSTEGDLCCDTDPHKVSASFTCTDTEINECTGNVYGDVVHNFMDYSDQDCQYMFTQDQMDRMRATLEGTRASLLVSKGLSAPAAAFTEPTAPTCEAESQALGLSGGYGGIMSVEFHTLNNVSSYTSNDGGYVNFADDCLKAVYVNPDSSYTMTVGSWNNSSHVKAWIDYDNSGTFDAGEVVYDQNHTGVAAQTTTVSQSVTIPNTANKDQFLRMRVVLEIGTITDPCMDLTYGQAEDYAIYIQDVHSVSGRIFEEAAEAKSSTCGVTGSANLALSLTKNGVEFYTTTTDGSGNFTFPAVTEGTYDLFVDSSAYTNGTAPEITVIEAVADLEYIHESTSLNICNNSIGINSIDNISNLSIAPNPVNNSLLLQFNVQQPTEVMYRITDVQGKIIFDGFIQANNLVAETFDVSQLTQGIYSFTLINQNGQSTVQFVKR